MNSLYDFIVEPIGDKYKNEIQVGDKKVVVNTQIESWKFVNRLAKVIKPPLALDRKSTRLNSSHRCISYAVFCLKKKNIAY